jgi:hypothetical protein
MTASSIAAQNSQTKQFGISEVVYFCDSNDPACAPASSFSVSTLRDLYIFVQWTNVPVGTHTQEVRFFLPESRTGTLWQSFNNSFFGPHGHKKVVTLEDDAPIAGTAIEHRLLTGTWRVDVYLDDVFYTSRYVQLDP